VTGSGLDRPDESITGRPKRAGSPRGPWPPEMPAAGSSSCMPLEPVARAKRDLGPWGQQVRFPSRPNVSYRPEKKPDVNSPGNNHQLSCSSTSRHPRWTRADRRGSRRIEGRRTRRLTAIVVTHGSVRPRGRAPRSSDGQGPHCRDRPGGRGVIDTAEPAHSSIS
jgi:hypothetical protein